MPHRSLTLEEFARHAGMDVNDVRRLAEAGKLPADRVGGTWRFHEAGLTEWLQSEMPRLDQDRLRAIERAMTLADAAAGTERVVEAESGDRIVRSLMRPQLVDLEMPARTSASALRELCAIVDRAELLYDGDGLLESLREREKMCSTALGSGIAIPHPRQPMPYATAEPLIAVGRVDGGIGFGEATGDLTRLFFLICCQSSFHHLQVLARLMRILSRSVRADLMSETDPDAFLDRIAAREDEVVASQSPGGS